TNNKMELQAVISGLRQVERFPGPVEVYTDSTYVIQGITQWIWAWRNRDWKTAEGKDVANAELWQRLSALVARRGKENPIEWKYVKGHSGIPGNERVDEIAVAFAAGKHITLFNGSLFRYSVPIHALPADTSVPKRDPTSEKKEKVAAYSYLSLINGRLERHSSWKECEARVKGRPGAKFKKTLSAEDEARILEEWHVPAEKLPPRS